MKKRIQVIERDEVVVKFAGDSGDGIQLTGAQFSDTSAFIGNDLATFPDYPAEIRAPQGTVAGVSGFQVHIGAKVVVTPGDLADVLVAMNPAALKANMQWLKPHATIIIDIDNFDSRHYKRAEYIEDPLEDGSLEGYNVVKAPITEMTRDVVKQFGLDAKTADKTKNQFVAGQAAIITTFLPAFILSGFIFDISSMPGFVQGITHLIAARYFVTILHAVFLAGNIWSVILPNALALLGMSVVFLGLSRLKSHKRLD